MGWRVSLPYDLTWWHLPLTEDDHLDLPRLQTSACLYISRVFSVVSLKFGTGWVQNATVPKAFCVGKVYVCVLGDGIDKLNNAVSMFYSSGKEHCHQTLCSVDRLNQTILLYGSSLSLYLFFFYFSLTFKLSWIKICNLKYSFLQVCLFPTETQVLKLIHGKQRGRILYCHVSDNYLYIWLFQKHTSSCKFLKGNIWLQPTPCRF